MKGSSKIIHDLGMRLQNIACPVLGRKSLKNIILKGRQIISLPGAPTCLRPALVGHWWNEVDTGKPKYAEKSLSQCHFVHHKSHIDYPGIAPGLRGERPATNRLNQADMNST